MSDTSQPVAGWYPDPENPTAERWWDGTGWTDHRRASTVAPAATYGGLPAYTPAPASPYGAPAYAAPAQQNNTLAVVGFVLAVGGIVISFGGLTPLAGGIVSIFALVRANRMRAQGLPFDRRGFAIAGIIVGFAICLLEIAALVVLLTLLPQLPGYSTDFGGSYS
jgi:hypothetical protein